jgi:hypothetical protein
MMLARKTFSDNIAADQVMNRKQRCRAVAFTVVRFDAPEWRFYGSFGCVRSSA